MKRRQPSPSTRATRDDRIVRDAMNALRRIVRALRLANGEVERLIGISVAQLFVLQQLADGNRSINELAAATATDPSTVSGIVKRLLQAKLIERKRAADDARRAEVSLTRAGAALLARAPAAPQELIVAAIHALPPRRRLAVSTGLIEIADRLGAASPAFFFED